MTEYAFFLNDNDSVILILSAEIERQKKGGAPLSLQQPHKTAPD